MKDEFFADSMLIYIEKKTKNFNIDSIMSSRI